MYVKNEHTDINITSEKMTNVKVWKIYLNFSKSDLNLLCSQGYFHFFYIVTLTFNLLSKINRIHPLIMGNNCAKSDQITLNGFISIVFTRLYPLSCIVT